jgi:hypothetical protein
MRNSWRQLFRRLAAGCVVTGSLAWSSAMSYAVQLAYDTADNAAYSDGWQEGDNGGFGFTGWNFDSGYWYNYTLYSYTNPGFLGVDNGLQSGTQLSNPHNHIGRSLVIGSHPSGDGAPRIGRGLVEPLEVGQTLSVVVDNPTRRQFFKGYFIQFHGGTGGVNGNLCGGNDDNNHACTPGAPLAADQLNMWRFEYNDYGQWQIADASNTYIPLYDVDTAAGGMKLDLLLTSESEYELTVTPLANPGLTHVHSGTLANPGEGIDWMQITFFNPVTDPTPTLAEFGTDFYIRSMEVIGEAPPGLPGDFNGDGKVDAADYVTWRKNNGTNNALPNDGGLGTPITTAHYDLWTANFGETAGSGGAAGAVPEPSTMVSLVGLVAGGLLVRRRV